MADHLTPEKRSWNMAQIKGKDTSVEVTVRKYLFSNGYRIWWSRGELNSGPNHGKSYRLHRLVRIVFRTFSLRKEKSCVMRSGRVIWNTLLTLVSGSADPVQLAVGSGPLCRGQFC